MLTECGPAGYFICQIIDFNDSIFLISNVYGYNTKQENDSLLLSIENILIGWLDRFPNASLLLGGDFNNILDSSKDKWPPSQQNRTNSNFTAYMNRFNLTNTWREKNHYNSSYTWSNKTGSNRSRLDFWFISNGFDKDDTDVSIWPTPLTDHKAICVYRNLSTVTKCVTQSGYWKLNITLLQNDEIKKEIRDLISFYWSKAKEENKFGFNWKLLKFEIGKFFRMW